MAGGSAPSAPGAAGSPFRGPCLALRPPRCAGLRVAARRGLKMVPPLSPAAAGETRPQGIRIEIVRLRPAPLTAARSHSHARVMGFVSNSGCPGVPQAQTCARTPDRD
ncbi:unnamed protein product [Coccothraustes coccothraustes]